MHDLHVADKVQRLVLAEAEKNKLKQVKQIDIELGAVVEHGADINPENLEFNLNMLLEGTIGEGAEIKIKKVDGNDWRLISISGE